MNAAATLENVYHEIMLRECKTEESQQWENARHSIMSESIKESCNYYGKCWGWKDEELER